MEVIEVSRCWEFLTLATKEKYILGHNPCREILDDGVGASQKIREVFMDEMALPAFPLGAYLAICYGWSEWCPSNTMIN